MKLIALFIALMTTSVFAAEFSAKIDNIDCKIADGKVIRTQSFGKESKVSFTETKTVVMNGTESYIRLVTETSSQIPSTEDDFGMSYSMTHEGKTYFLGINDSKEMRNLIRMITHMCR